MFLEHKVHLIFPVMHTRHDPAPHACLACPFLRAKPSDVFSPSTNFIVHTYILVEESSSTSARKRMTDSIKNKRTNETLRSLEFDLDVILSDENNEHAPPILPRIIAADDQQTLSTLDRDQSLLTQDEPPPFVISRPTHERRHERFVDEEAPSRPRVHDYSSTLEKEVDGKGIDEVEEDRRGPFSFRELYVAAFIMSLVLLAVITGLAIWFITVKMGDQEQVHANPNIRAETDDDFAWIQLTPSPMTPPPSTLVTLTPLTPVPSVAATDAVISPSSSPTLRPAVATPPPTTSRPTPSPSAAPTDESVAIQQARARFLTILEERSPTLLQTLQEPESTHFQALEWLIRDPDFFTYSPNRVIQRWVLALFALGLSSWDSLQQLKQTGLPPQLQTWVQYTNECSWFFSQVDSSDVLCNNQGEYVRLDLRDMNLAGTIPSELSLLSNSLGTN